MKKTQEERFCLTRDEDSHWYLIPASQKETFEKCCEEAYQSDEFDKFEKSFGTMRIDGPQGLTFSNPTVD